MRPPTAPKTNTQASPANQTSVKMTLLPAVVRELEGEQAKLRQIALKLAKPSELRVKGADIVLCQCGHLEEEGGAMVRFWLIYTLFNVLT